MKPERDVNYNEEQKIVNPPDWYKKLKKMENNLKYLVYKNLILNNKYY